MSAHEHTTPPSDQPIKAACSCGWHSRVPVWAAEAAWRRHRLNVEPWRRRHVSSVRLDEARKEGEQA